MKFNPDYILQIQQPSTVRRWGSIHSLKGKSHIALAMVFFRMAIAKPESCSSQTD